MSGRGSGRHAAGDEQLAHQLSDPLTRAGGSASPADGAAFPNPCCLQAARGSRVLIPAYLDENGPESSDEEAEAAAEDKEKAKAGKKEK